MRNTAIYTELHKAHTTRMVRVGDTTQQLYAQQSIGEITGQYRTLPAIVSTGAQLDDAWQIVNLYIKQGYTDRYSDSCNSINSRYVGSVAVLGALDSAQAEAWALRQFSLETGATGACQACTTNAQALRLLLDHPASADELEIHSQITSKFENRVTLTDVVWQGALLKTPERSTDLIHQMQILDRDGQLLDAMVPADMSVLLTELGATEAEYDALIVEYGTGDGSGINLLMNRLNAAMNKASVGKVKPVNVTLTKPFKRNSVTNVAVLFEFDDGQSVTIVFHNPDSTPGKLASGDILTSWKIMLNKRDVTAALSPPEGENVQLPDLAKRILLVVEKNSARFQRANTKKAEDVAALEAAQGRVDEKKQKLTGLLAEIEGLEKALDESMKQTNSGNNESLKQGMVNNADGTYTAMTFTQSKTFKTKAGAVKWLAQRGLNPDGSVLERPRPREIDVSDIHNMGVVEITHQGNENIYFVKDGREHFSKVMNTQDYPVGEFDLSQYPQGLSSTLENDPLTPEQLNEQAFEGVKAILVKEYGWTPTHKYGLKKSFSGTQASGELNPEGETVFMIEANGALIAAKSPNGMEEPITIASEYLPQYNQNDTAYRATAKKLAAEVESTVINLRKHLEEKLKASSNTLPSNPDAQFFQSIIDGSVDALTVDMDHVIELGEKYPDDQSMMDLLEKALEVINQAEQAAAQSVA